MSETEAQSLLCAVCYASTRLFCLKQCAVVSREREGESPTWRLIKNVAIRLGSVVCGSPTQGSKGATSLALLLLISLSLLLLWSPSLPSTLLHLLLLLLLLDVLVLKPPSPCLSRAFSSSFPEVKQSYFPTTWLVQSLFSSHHLPSSHFSRSSLRSWCDPSPSAA